MFIKRLDLKSDVELVNSELAQVLVHSPFTDKKNQIGLTSRSDSEDKWYDASGSLYDNQGRKYVANENEFTEWNLESSSYVRQQVDLLCSMLDIKVGRVRFMRLLPHRGLSVHRDTEMRYHLVLKTNPNAYISHSVLSFDKDRSEVPTSAICYHLPCNGRWYQVDTRETHWVYNGGDEERIHLVVCGIES